MQPDSLINIYTSVGVGSMCLMAATLLMLRIVLSSPDQPNYPTARPRVQFSRFLWLLFLAYRGVEIIAVAVGSNPVELQAGQLGATFALALNQAFELDEQIRTWLPAKTHRFIRKMLDLAYCGRLPGVKEARAQSLANVAPEKRTRQAPTTVVPAALAQLAMDGFMVVPPHAGPEAVTQARKETMQ